MAIKHISYADLTPEQRRKGAEEARKRLSGMLMAPFLTPEQQLAIQAQLKNIDDWEQGRLPVARKPVNHSVGIGEAVKVAAKTG